MLISGKTNGKNNMYQYVLLSISFSNHPFLLQDLHTNNTVQTIRIPTARNTTDIQYKFYF